MRNQTTRHFIRPETSEDIVAIHTLTKSAFHGKSFSDGTEPDLINALRNVGALTLSLVADDAGTILGHVAISPAIAADGSDDWYALGPIAVVPTCQRQGIGGHLIRGSMERLIAMKARGCIVLGDTKFYPRHGFVPRPDLSPPGQPAAHYMVRALNGQTPDTVVDFHPIFQMTGTK
jgi:predicted N-acetyltransferase YhbS